MVERYMNRRKWRENEGNRRDNVGRERERETGMREGKWVLVFCLFLFQLTANQ